MPTREEISRLVTPRRNLPLDKFPDPSAELIRIIKKAGEESAENRAGFNPQTDIRSVIEAKDKTETESYNVQYYIRRFFLLLPAADRPEMVEYLRSRDLTEAEIKRKTDLIFAEFFSALIRNSSDIFEYLKTLVELSYSPEYDKINFDALNEFCDEKQRNWLTQITFLISSLQLLSLDEEQKNVLRTFTTELQNARGSVGPYEGPWVKELGISFSSKEIQTNGRNEYIHENEETGEFLITERISAFLQSLNYVSSITKHYSLTRFFEVFTQIKEKDIFIKDIFADRDLRMLDFSDVKLHSSQKTHLILNTIFHIDGEKENFFGSSILDGVNFRDAELERASFAGGMFIGANFESTRGKELPPKWEGALDFSNANCTEANFSGRNFVIANFSGATLIDSLMSDVCFIEVDFRGANLTGARIHPRPDEQRLWEASTVLVDNTTRLPNGEMCSFDGTVRLEELL